MDDKIRIQFDFLNAKIENLQSYHNHKETMVNAGFVVQLSLFATIIMENIWPPNWIEGIGLLSNLSTCFVYTLFWLLVHVFITWQLQNKIISSLYLNGYEVALRRLTFSHLSEKDYQIENPSNTSIKKYSRIMKFIGRIIPPKSQVQKFDINNKHMPLYITREIEQSLKNGTAAKGHERLMIFGSLLMWFLTMIRMFANFIY